MTVRREWFKRQIEILAQAMGTVLGLKGKGDVQSSLAAIEVAVEKAFGMKGAMALGLSLDDFLSFACRGETPDAAMLDEMSRFFGEWAVLLQSSGRSVEAAQAQARAAALKDRAVQAA